MFNQRLGQGCYAVGADTGVQSPKWLVAIYNVSGVDDALWAVMQWFVVVLSLPLYQAPAVLAEPSLVMPRGCNAMACCCVITVTVSSSCSAPTGP